MVVVRRWWPDNAHSIHHFDAIDLVELQDTSVRSDQPQNGAGSGGKEVRRKYKRNYLELFVTYNVFEIIFSMANLLNKLRIDYSSLTMLHGMSQEPSQATIDMHGKLLEGFTEGVNKDYCIPHTERESLKVKTNRQLRLREFLVEHSKSASLVVMSLPMPRQVHFKNTYQI